MKRRQVSIGEYVMEFRRSQIWGDIRWSIGIREADAFGFTHITPLVMSFDRTRPALWFGNAPDTRTAYRAADRVMRIHARRLHTHEGVQV